MISGNCPHGNYSEACNQCRQVKRALAADLWECPTCGRTNERAGVTWGCSTCLRRFRREVRS